MDTSKLKAIRTGHRGAATKILKRISEGCEDSVLEECLKTLTSKRDILQDLHGQIVNGLTDEEEITTEITESDEYIINLNIQIKEHYGKIFPSKENEQEQPSRELPGEIAYHNLSANAPNYIPISSKSNHKLPKLDLPTFSGELLDWQTFWDCYDTSIHSNSALSNVEKFSYLRSLLRGEALQAITGFALTNTNYGQAVEVLFERYGQTHRIVNAYMQNMVELPSPHDISSLKLFFDTTETYIRGLESLGVYVETYSSLLVPVILKKLPRDFLRDTARQNGSDRWDLHSLRDAIKRELRVHESANIAFEFTNNQPTTSTFLTRSRHTNNEYMSKTQTAKFDLSKRPCVFCKEIHAPVDCTMSHDERIEKIKSERLCFNCLGRHKVSDCRSTNTCKKCKRKHHTSICPGDNTNTTTTSASLVSMHSAISSTPQVLLKTAVAEVQSENARCESNILFDEGSQRSFITRKLADELELSTLGKETLNMSGFGSMKGEIRQLDKVQILVIGEHGQRVHLEALVVPNIGVPLRTHSSDIKSLPYLRNLKLAHGNPGNHPFEIQILIGADFYWNFVLDHVVRGSGPTAVKSQLGYLLSGPSYTSNTKDGVSIGIYNVLANHRGEEINIAKFWEIEDLPNKERMDSKSKLHEYQEKAITHKDDRFTAKLPWKEEHPELPTNRNVAKQRLSSVVKRLNRETGMLKMYDNIIKDQEKRGFIEEVKEDEAENTHYIPHHPVKKDSSTTPIRIVFDCSCKETHESASLNDCLETNAPQLNDLTTLLTKFRMNKYAVTTDIEKAFLQVGLEEEDRNYTRFFWLRDCNDPSSEIVTYRFKVVLFGATCSPFILHATLLKLFQDNSSTTSEELEESLYVDNVLTSFSDEESLLSFYTEARQLLQKGGFNLRTWNSNSSRLRSQAVTDCVEDSSQNVKILGMRWNVDSDKLSYPHLDITDTTSKTKREVLTQLSKLFDPLGFLSPVTIRAKIFIQELWKQNYTWDVPLPPDITDNWNNILQDLKSATKLDIQRCINRLQDDSQGQLHIFTDASQYAYGACAYLAHGEQSILLMSKNRVAPLKTLTLPRMELMGATIGAQLCSHLQSVLNVNSVTLWCDSQIVLHWLKSDKLLKRFISKRINEIKELTGTHEWRYVPTDNNPADLQTRGIAASELLESNFWIHGPEWITSQSNWPIWNSDVTVTMMSQTQQEMEQNDEVQPGSSENSKNISPIFSLEKYSSYSKILRITAFVFRFINNCKTTTEKRTQGPIKPDELNRATKYWIRIAQTDFGEVFECLRSGKRNDLIRQLKLYVDSEGMIRSKGRIDNAKLPQDTKFPLLLPKTHGLTKRIVNDTHKRNLHSGPETTIVTLREKFWIPSIRQVVQHCIRNCVTCRKVTGNHFRAPDPPPLPKDRLRENTPFIVTGVDFTGALHVKTGNRMDKKVYICLFTCASTRAIHLEIVTDLTENAFLLAFRRFVSKKSTPKIMLSDNGTTFLAAAETIRKLSNSEIIKNKLQELGTEWKFIPKKAPWFGGFWERLIGIIKTTIFKVLGSAYISLEELQTLISEVEMVVNDRPLTHVSTDVRDRQPLTPSHLLYGRRIVSPVYPDERQVLEGQNVSHTSANTEFSRKTELLRHFWIRWKRDYVTSLREFQRASGTLHENVKVGDIVQIHSDSKRIYWKLAVIEELVTGCNGLSRSAIVRTSTGRTNRPITKLFPLELNISEPRRSERLTKGAKYSPINQ